jgi:HPt (histidine-containing phosphotransfer) domain-containing protein
MAEAKPAVDLVHLARYTGGDVALNAEILRLFDMQTSEMVDQLRSVLDAADAKSWKEITHTLKGAARGIGAFLFADAVALAEPMDVIRDREKASGAIDALKLQAAEVQSFIRSYTAG